MTTAGLPCPHSFSIEGRVMNLYYWDPARRSLWIACSVRAGFSGTVASFPTKPIRWIMLSARRTLDAVAESSGSV